MNLRFSKKYQSGISLVEVLISTAILGILIISTLELFTFFKDDARKLETLQVENIENKSLEKLRTRVSSNTQEQLNKSPFCSLNLSFNNSDNCQYNSAQIVISQNHDALTDRLDLTIQNIAGLDDSIQFETAYDADNGILTTTSNSVLTADQWKTVLELVRISEDNLPNPAPARLIELTFRLNASSEQCPDDTFIRPLDLAITRKYCSN